GSSSHDLPSSEEEVTPSWIELRLFNGGITDISSNREHPSLFRPCHLVVQNCFLHQSFLDILPPLLPKGKTGKMSGGHSEPLTAGNIHEVQNSIALYSRVIDMWKSIAFLTDSW